MADVGTGISRTREQIGDEAQGIESVRIFNEQLTLTELPIRIMTRDVTNDSIWGNGSAWGSDEWQGEYNNELTTVTVTNSGNNAFNRMRARQITIDDCDSTTGWTASDDATSTTTNTTTKTQGTSSLNVNAT